MRDSKFRESMPSELSDDLRKYLQNPSCPCNMEFYRKVLKSCVTQLKAYYPGNEVVNPETELPPLQENSWTVINCSINEIENKLKALGPGRKQIVVARYEDQATVIINDLDT